MLSANVLGKSVELPFSLTSGAISLFVVAWLFPFFRAGRDLGHENISSWLRHERKTSGFSKVFKH